MHWKRRQLRAWVEEPLINRERIETRLEMVDAFCRDYPAADGLGEALAGVAESAESLQVNSDTTLKRHNWPKDQFYGPGQLSGANTWDNNSSLGLSYALDLWGRESNTTERAVDLAHMSAAEARLAQLELQNNVVRAYIQLSLQYANHDIAAATRSGTRPATTSDVRPPMQ